MSAHLTDLDALASAECARHWIEKLLQGEKSEYYTRAWFARLLVCNIIRSAKARVDAADLAARLAITSPGGDA